MGEDSGERYDQVPYPGRPVAWATPAALSLTSRCHGGPTLDPTAPLRVLEIGCGDGAHLVPLAFFRPHLECVGVDVSERALGRAQDAATKLGLEGVRFVRADLAALAPPERAYDVVMAHGVYSWIDAARRSALRRVAAQNLSDDGLLFVSFNAQPGWSVRGRVRDALTRLRTASLDEARARIEALRASVPAEPTDAWTHMLAHELERAAASSDGYLAHEYLAEDNVPFWLGDVVRDFADEGLRYVGDATFDRAEGFVAPALRDAAAQVGSDAIAREEWIDLRAFRQMRCAVFSKTTPAPAPPRLEVVREAWIAGAPRRRNDSFDLRQGMEEIFDGPRGVELRIESAALKVALLLLADRWPRGTRLEALYAECQERLAPWDIEPEPLEQLAPKIATLHEQMQLELRLVDPELRTLASDRPSALPLTRHEAAARDLLTTPLHTMLPLEPIDRALVARLDGEHTRGAITEAVAQAIVAGELELEGAPAGLARVTPLVEARLEATLTTLGWWGLVR